MQWFSGTRHLQLSTSFHNLPSNFSWPVDQGAWLISFDSLYFDVITNVDQGAWIDIFWFLVFLYHGTIPFTLSWFHDQGGPRCLDQRSWTYFDSLYFDVMIILFTISWFFQNYQDKFQPLYSVRIQSGITSWWRSMGTRRPSARWPWVRSTLTSFHTRSNHASIMLPPSFRMRSND